GRNQAEAEAVAFFFVLLSVVLQVAPELVAQGILWIHASLQNSAHLLRNSRNDNLSEIKSNVFSIALLIETDHKSPLAMLGNKVFTVNNTGIKRIIQLLQCLLDNLERVSLIVGNQILYVLKEKGLGAIPFNDIGYVEKQVALLFIG